MGSNSLCMVIRFVKGEATGIVVLLVKVKTGNAGLLETALGIENSLSLEGLDALRFHMDQHLNDQHGAQKSRPPDEGQAGLQESTRGYLGAGQEALQTRNHLFTTQHAENTCDARTGVGARHG